MASYRRKYASLDVEAPVTTAPTEAAKPPDIVENPKPIIEPASAESNPVEQAAQSAIKQRLAEMENAAGLQHAPPAQQAPQEPQQSVANEPAPPDVDAFMEKLEEAIAPLPNEDAKRFFRLHPELIFDPEKNAAANHFHNVAIRETGETFTPRYFERLETHLGLLQPDEPSPQPQRQTAPSRPSGPAVSVSAPVQREAPSMSTGRPVSSSKIHLNADEQQIAWASRPRADMTKEEANVEYARHKRRIQQLRAEGYHSDG